MGRVMSGGPVIEILLDSIEDVAFRVEAEMGYPKSHPC
jgi:hypothetical protein